MNPDSAERAPLHFGPYEADLAAGELRRNGIRLKLQDQPFQVLAALLERPGEVVTREEFRQRLWADDTFVDFDNALNTAINKIREVLEDSARHPRFVETVPRRGYRWIGEAPASPDAEESDSQRPHRRAWWYAASVLFVISLIAAAVGFSLRNRREPGPATELPLTAQHLTSLVGIEDSPTLSPDGSQVAFVWNGEDQDNADIYVQMIGSGNPLRLTSSEEPDLYPAWSPDGRSIAFQRQAADGDNGIYLVPPLGGPERKVGTAKGYGLSWSPDSRYLVISDRESENQSYDLYLVSIQTGERRVLTSPSGASIRAYIASAFSPDGRTLAFSKIWEGLMLLELSDDLSAAGDPRGIARNSAYTSGMAWTADGTELVYSSGNLFRRSLYRVNADGSSPATQLGFAAQEAGDGVALSAPSPIHGGRLVFSRGSRDSNIYRLDLSREGHEVRQFASSTLSDSSPQFSPDGTKVAFASNRAENLGAQIWVCEADGSNALQLTFCKDGFCGSPRWSPDGKWIVFDRHWAEKGQDIYVISSDGGPTRRVTKHSGTDFLPSWSVDGNWIYFSSNRSGEYQIWKIPFAGGDAQMVTHNGGHTAFESPDGSSIYYTKSAELTTSLWKVPASGGQEVEVLYPIFNRNFVVTKSGIWHAVELNPHRSEIRLFDFSSGESKVVYKMNGSALYALTVSPDEKSILFVQADQTNSDLMLVENFQ